MYLKIRAVFYWIFKTYLVYLVIEYIQKIRRKFDQQMLLIYANAVSLVHAQLNTHYWLS